MTYNFDEDLAKGTRVFVVDDNPTNLDVLSDYLDISGFEVFVATDGESAVERVDHINPDIILLDVMMPGIDGFETCQRLKSNPETKDIPIIFMSALSEMPDKVKGFEVGAVDYITKPLQYQEVFVRIKTHLTLRNLQKNLEIKNAELEQEVTHRKQVENILRKTHDELAVRAEALAQLNQKMTAELQLAHQIQTGLLLPTKPEWTQLDIICYTSPVQEIGGDFYHYVQLSETHFSIGVGDISGKGVSAALLMATSLAQFDVPLPVNTNPGKRVAFLDKLITPYAKPSHQNCALCYLEIHIEADDQLTLSIVNAGAIPPYIKRENGQVEHHELGGFALGLGLGSELGYKVREFQLTRGDMIVLVSDGVIEAKNNVREILGFDQLQDIIEQGPLTDSNAMLEHLKTHIGHFTRGARWADDITIVVIKV